MIQKEGLGPKRLLALIMRWLPASAVVATLLYLARGGFRNVAQLGWVEAAIVCLLLIGIGVSAHYALMQSSRGNQPSLRGELSLGGSLVAAAYVVVAIFGQALFPLIYLLIAFLVSFLSRGAGLTLVGVGLVFDALGNGQTNPASFVIHAIFLVLFAALYHLILSGRLAAARRAEMSAVANRIREVEERARTFRLVSSGSRDSTPGVKEEEKWLLASVKEVEGAVGNALEIVENALKTHTSAVFLLTADDLHLKLYDCRSVSEHIEREKVSAGEGVLGGVIKRGVPVRMHAASGLKSLTYYDSEGPTVGALLVVPIVEAAGLVRGVLIADRLEKLPFSELDEKLLITAASQVLRAIEVERVMGYIRKTRDEKDKFFRAIEEMNRANSPEQVFSAVLEGARQIAAIDFCAVTLVSEPKGKREHRVARLAGVSGDGGRALEGMVFADNNGLVANVVRYGAPLPGRDVALMDRQVIFDADTQVRGLGALKIFPLTAGDRILGTLVCGSRKKSAIDEDALRMLEVIAIQAAQAVLRAQLYEQMEKMATTDGLTGLLNHRMFQTRADEALSQSKRYSRRCSLILTDIDHFKTVNDTYGHPTGDFVLKGVARILRDKAREADVVARYGGEEFAIIMPETDSKGALAIAERIREAVAAETFQTENGPLKVTLSLGIATFPDNSTEKQGLIDLADQCLYFAKRNGRNQSVTVAKMQGGRKLQAVDG